MTSKAKAMNEAWEKLKKAMNVTDDDAASELYRDPIWNDKWSTEAHDYFAATQAFCEYEND